MGFSGAYNWDESKELFEEACSYFVEDDPDVIFLMSHWNIPGQSINYPSMILFSMNC